MDKKQLNIFLSNFSEIWFTDFDRSDPPEEASLVNFVHLHTKLNDPHSIGYVTQDDGMYETLRVDLVDDQLERFFGVSVPHRGFALNDYYNVSCDGTYYYYPAADGESYNYFTAVKKFVRLEDGTYRVEFSVFALDLELYFDQGIPDLYYDLHATEAERFRELTLCYTGGAILEDYKLNGKPSYRLISLWRDN